jgi:hypothetical protein
MIPGRAGLWAQTVFHPVSVEEIAASQGPALNVAAAAFKPGPKASAATPEGSSASVHRPQSQRTRIWRCSVTSIRS